MTAKKEWLSPQPLEIMGISCFDGSEETPFVIMKSRRVGVVPSGALIEESKRRMPGVSITQVREVSQ